MGAVTDVVKQYVPGSYRALVGATNVYDYDQGDLQALADYVKFKLMGTIVSSAAEATLYDALLVNFLGKVTTLQFIPAAVDYWGDQLVSETATGSNESRSYPDRRDGLWKIFDDLRAQVQQEMEELAPIYGFKIHGVQGMIPKVSYGDNGRSVLITSDPQDFGREFAQSNACFDDPIIWTVNS